MQKLERFNVLLVDDAKPSWRLDVKMVDTLKINMYVLCKVLGCWLWVGEGSSMPYLTCIERIIKALNAL